MTEAKRLTDEQLEAIRDCRRRNVDMRPYVDGLLGHIATLTSPTLEDVARDYETVCAVCRYEPDALVRLRDWAARAQALEAEVGRLNAELQESGVMQRGLANTVSKLTESLRDAESERDAARQEAERLATAHRAEMHQMMEQVAEATRGHEAMMGERNEYAAEVAALRSQVATLEEERAAQHQRACDAVAHASAHKARAEAAERRVAELEAVVKRLEGRDRQRRGFVSQLQDTVQRLKEGTPEASATPEQAVESQALGPIETCSYCSTHRRCSRHVSTPYPSTAGLAGLVPLESIARNRAMSSQVAKPATHPAPAGLLEASAPLAEYVREALAARGRVPPKSFPAKAGRVFVAAFDAAKGGDGPDMEALCEVMHDAYEAAAKGNGWETQERSRKPWADVPEANKATMRAAVSALLRHLGLTLDTPPSGPGGGEHPTCARCGRTFPGRAPHGGEPCDVPLDAPTSTPVATSSCSGDVPLCGDASCGNPACQRRTERAAPAVVWEGDGVHVFSDGRWDTDDHAQRARDGNTLARALAEANREAPSPREAHEMRKAHGAVRLAGTDGAVTCFGSGDSAVLVMPSSVYESGTRKAAESMRERAAKHHDDAGDRARAWLDVNESSMDSRTAALVSAMRAALETHRAAAIAIRALPLEDK